ncbi:hypothetical protein VCHA40P242_170001 [Vibrio chagasii]|nr:hypothetical protein VCHA40P242_170001 [Vibrio chagasii]CAH6994637.1 hypothetical protein VCHA36P164_40249 [Vibrio chagasii]
MYTYTVILGRGGTNEPGISLFKLALVIFKAIPHSLRVLIKRLLKTIDSSFHFMLLSRAISERPMFKKSRDCFLGDTRNDHSC